MVVSSAPFSGVLILVKCWAVLLKETGVLVLYFVGSCICQLVRCVTWSVVMCQWWSTEDRRTCSMSQEVIMRLVQKLSRESITLSERMCLCLSRKVPNMVIFFFIPQISCFVLFLVAYDKSSRNLQNCMCSQNKISVLFSHE